MESTQQLPSLLTAFGGGREGEPAWLRDLRQQARDHFEAVGFPTSKLEEWKNTNVSAIAKTDYAPAPAAGAAAFAGHPALDFCARRLVFVDGRLDHELSTGLGDTDGIWVGTLAQAREQQSELAESMLARRVSPQSQPFAALNTALFDEATVIRVHGTAGEPLHVLHLASRTDRPPAAFPRLLVQVDAGAEARLVESFFGADEANGLTCAVAEIDVAENAGLEHVRLQFESGSAHHVGNAHATVARSGRYTCHAFDFGAKLARVDSTAKLNGEGSNCLLNCLYLVSGEQHVDNHTMLDHAMPHGDSREVYKGILADKGRAVFNGRIRVQLDAQKTDAKQSNPNLLMTEGALVHTRPQLEIYADDVKCTHGATIGQLDAEALFYLQSRGIGGTESRNMLVRGFAAELLDQVPVESVRHFLEEAFARRLDAIRSSGS